MNRMDTKTKTWSTTYQGQPGEQVVFSPLHVFVGSFYVWPQSLRPKDFVLLSKCWGIIGASADASNLQINWCDASDLG